MKIEANTFVSLEYRLIDVESGKCIDDATTTSDPMSFVAGYGMVVPGLEAALVGMTKGQSKHVELEASDAFGVYDEGLVFDIALSELPEGMTPSPGDELEITVEGEPDSFTVLGVEGDRLLLDANHPLAGRRLLYEVKVVDVRAATDEEIEAAAEAFESAQEEIAEEAGAELVTLRTKRPN